MEALVVQATRIGYGRVHLQTILEEEEPSTSPAVDKKQATRISKVRMLLSTLHLTFYLPHSQQYVLILLQSLRRKLFSAKGTAPI